MLEWRMDLFQYYWNSKSLCLFLALVVVVVVVVELEAVVRICYYSDNKVLFSMNIAVRFHSQLEVFVFA
jgi:hypothetical protein